MKPFCRPCEVLKRLVKLDDGEQRARARARVESLSDQMLRESNIYHSMEIRGLHGKEGEGAGVIKRQHESTNADVFPLPLARIVIASIVIKPPMTCRERATSALLLSANPRIRDSPARPGI